MKKVFKSIIKNLIGGVIGTGLVLLFFYILGIIEQIIENHFWLMIPLTIYIIYLFFEEINREG